jgi:dimethylhistidine N-methyltransferase
MTAPANVRVHECGPESDDFLAEVLLGLAQPQKVLPCKFLYDQRGSELFDRICDLAEYYPTRTELRIMQEHAPEMAEAMGEEVLLIEYGSGSSLKTRVLLDHLGRPAGYVPIDISREHLAATARQLQKDYPGLPVHPVWADYTRPFTLPRESDRARRRVVYFPGSTVGNFMRADACAFLKQAAQVVGPGGSMLIGVDLRKDPSILERAYNDSEGVTAAFNLNLLRRINRELEGGFDLNRFIHQAVFNDEMGRIEMHLVSRDDHEVQVGDTSFHFQKGETIRTECSHKYTVESFADLAGEAGWTVDTVWTDDKRLFSVQLLGVRQPV